MKKENVVSAKNLTVAYGENTVIKRVNFEIYRGDFVCVVGANGAGKSTLIKAVLGLIKVDGQVDYGAGVAKNSIGYLPQESKIEQNFPATVFEIVISGTLGRLGRKPFYHKENRERAIESMRILGIESLEHEMFSDLSGGQKQKVLLARALAATSTLMVLDEPSNNLDYASRQEFYETLKSLNSKNGMTIIMITHDLDAEDLIGNKVLAISDGKITYSSTSDYLEKYR